MHTIVFSLVYLGGGTGRGIHVRQPSSLALVYVFIYLTWMGTISGEPILPYLYLTLSQFLQKRLYFGRKTSNGLVGLLSKRHLAPRKASRKSYLLTFVDITGNIKSFRKWRISISDPTKDIVLEKTTQNKPPSKTSSAAAMWTAISHLASHRAILYIKNNNQPNQNNRTHKTDQRSINPGSIKLAQLCTKVRYYKIFKNKSK